MARIARGEDPVDLSVIIVTHNSAAFIEECLQSVLDSDADATLEIIVVDNRSDDDTRERTRSRAADATILVPKSRGGFARNANLGIEVGRGRRLLLLNPDAVLDPQALRVAMDHLDAHPEVGAAGCRIMNSDGTQEASFRCLPSLWTVFCESFLLDRVFPRSRHLARRTMRYADRDAVQSAEWLSGAFILFRRSVMQGDQAHTPVGPLDESIFLFVEDTEWCRRIREAGWALHYVPDARVVHYKGHGAAWDAWRYTLTCKGTEYYFRKYQGAVAAATYRALLVPGLLLRASLASASMLIPGTPRDDRRRRVSGYLEVAGLALTGALSRWQPTPR